VVGNELAVVILKSFKGHEAVRGLRNFIGADNDVATILEHVSLALTLRFDPVTSHAHAEFLMPSNVSKRFNWGDPTLSGR
jgi:hypothetical protein